MAGQRLGHARHTTCHVAWTRALVSAHPSLSSAENARAYSYRDPAARARFVTGAALLRRLAADLLGGVAAEVEVHRRCRWCGGPHGRPELVGGWNASVTHTTGLVGVAVTAAGAVGLDAETVRPTDRRLLPDLLAARDPVPRDDRELLRLWTAKESVLKATGDGLTRPMTTFTAADPAQGLQRPATVVQLHPDPACVAAVTVLRRGGVLVVTHAPAAA